MAENNTTASRDLICEGSTTSMSNFRCVLAIDAAAEIEELCKVLREATKEVDGTGLVVRGFSARIEELSKVIMGALGDESEETGELAYRLRLEQEESPRLEGDNSLEIQAIAEHVRSDGVTA